MSSTIFDDLVDPSSGPIAGTKTPLTIRSVLMLKETARDIHGKPIFGTSFSYGPVVVVKKMERFRKADGDEVTRSGMIYGPPTPALDLTWQFDLKDGSGIRKIIHVDTAPDEGPDGYQGISFT